MRTPLPRSSKLRWLLLIVGGALLSLLLASGTLAIRFLDKMHAQQQVVSHALGVRTQMLSGLLFSIQSYNDAVQQFVAQEQADQAPVRRHLDQLTVEIDADLRSYPNDSDSAEAALLN